MRIITFEHKNMIGAGVLTPDHQIIVKDEGKDALNAVRHFVESGEDIATWQGGKASLSLDEVQLLAPIPVPARNIFCVGLNYYDHAEEYSKSDFDKSDKPA
ncbi:MAG: hydrolase, partial [Alphaproteobacteria bacterium]|nr:hydrolase [Alphaproteobacteria bacterium]